MESGTLLCNVRGWTRDGKNSCGGMAISIKEAWVATDTDGLSFIVNDWLPLDISNGGTRVDIEHN